MSAPHVVVVGAGVGGLSAALDLAAGGASVTLLERHGAPGGKVRQLEVAGRRIDSGPTVFTMRWVFEDLFRAAGRSFAEHVTLEPADILARHSWLDGSRLDLYADVERSAAAVGELSGAREADAYRRFAAQSQRIFETLDASFMRRERPTLPGLVWSMGVRGVPRLHATKPFTTLWRELGRIFRDPRLRQLFARYATYCGSSPLDAPATLMLIAHAERAGVWMVDGGMQAIAGALAQVVGELGVTVRLGAEATRIRVEGGRARGVELADGELVEADAVVFNGDVAALAGGLLGPAVSGATPRRAGERRSLSAVTWSMVTEVRDFPLEHHTVFFGDDYPAEFESIFARREITEEPTVYVCAQDRGLRVAGRGGAQDEGRAERLLLLVNAPPRPLDEAELARCEARMTALLRRHGFDLDPSRAPSVRTGPADFDGLFPGSEGAIYGWPTHGMRGSFRRQGSRSRVPGLYLAGGTVHPGPGVPMTALSGRIAAASLRADLAMRSSSQGCDTRAPTGRGGETYG